MCGQKKGGFGWRRRCTSVTFGSVRQYMRCGAGLVTHAWNEKVEFRWYRGPYVGICMVCGEALEIG